MSDSDAPVRDALAAMTIASMENSDLPAREHMIARIAALIAVDAAGRVLRAQRWGGRRRRDHPR